MATAAPAGATPAIDGRCDVAIVGAGITGSLLAEHLASRGLQVYVIDHQKPGMSSTAASTVDCRAGLFC